MRHRLTHIFDSIESIDINSLTITQNSISTRNPIKSAREDKITLNIDEVPLELFRLLKVSQELHVRWIAEKPYKKTRPFNSILSPGLHLIYTPKRNRKSLASLCSLLKKAFEEIDCDHSEHSFTALPANQFFNDTSYYYYTQIPSISNFIDFLRYITCSQFSSDLSERCVKQVTDFNRAVYIDICFIKSNSLVISSFRPVDTQLFSIRIPKDISSKIRYEIGLLAPEPSQDYDTLSYGGFLIVAGEDTKPKPTRFSFQSRHRYSNVNFQSNFLMPSGIHPSLEIKVSDVAQPIRNQECGLYVYLTFPRNIFLDKYQFLDALFLTDKNISALAFIDDTVDLEAPEYTIPSWGSSALIKLATPAAKQNPTLEWTAHIPTHLRYLLPASNSSGLLEIEIPYPVVFWACNPKEYIDFSNNPFDRIRLGYDHFFDPITVFYHLNPNPSQKDGRLINRLQVPVLNLDQTFWVKSWTLWAIGLGFIWLCWCLLKVAMRTGYMSFKEKAYDNKKKTF